MSVLQAMMPSTVKYKQENTLLSDLPPLHIRNMTIADVSQESQTRRSFTNRWYGQSTNTTVMTVLYPLPILLAGRTLLRMTVFLLQVFLMALRRQKAIMPSATC